MTPIHPVLQQQQLLLQQQQILTPNSVISAPFTPIVSQPQQQQQPQIIQQVATNTAPILPVVQQTTNLIHPAIEQHINETQVIKPEVPSSVPQSQQQQLVHPTHSNVYNNSEDSSNNNEISRQDTIVTQASIPIASTTSAINTYDQPISKQQTQQNEDSLNISALNNQLTSVFNKKRTDSNETQQATQIQVPPISSFQQVTSATQLLLSQNSVAQNTTAPSQVKQPLQAQQSNPMTSNPIAATITTTTNSVTASIPTTDTVGVSRRNSKEQNKPNQTVDELEIQSKTNGDGNNQDTTDSNLIKSLQQVKNDEKNSVSTQRCNF